MGRFMVTARSIGALLAVANALSCSNSRPPASTPQAAAKRTVTREVQAAEIVFRHGAIYTVTQPAWAEAVAVRGGRIVYVGADAGVLEWVGAKTTVVDLKGKMLLPGFHDAHVHPMQSGTEAGECDLTNIKSPEQMLDTVRRYAGEHTDLPWIRGAGWRLPAFPGANPSKALLDRIVPDRPVYLDSDDGHSAWVSSRALAIAGVTAKTSDPPGGHIERDPKTGAPTGTLRESARDLVASKIPPRSVEDYVRGLARGLAEAQRYGITSMLEADATDRMLEAYRIAETRGELRSRIRVALHYEPALGTTQIAHLLDLRARYRTERLRPTAVKIFADGVIESRTAALVEPYVGGQGGRGMLNLDPASLSAAVAALDANGFQVHVHAIGDAAVRAALDAFEHARRTNGARDARHEIAHLELVQPADRPRFKELGVVANVEPLWAYADENVTALTIPVLGTARSRWIYPIASLLGAGAALSCGSDWSVTSINPLEGIQVGVTRRDPDDKTSASFLPEEAVSLDAMLACYTSGGAYAAFREGEMGTIETGKLADLVVLDRNLFGLDPSEIRDTRVLLTLLEGHAVYVAAGEADLARVPS
jgi:predicted amidohydrolase YtcJ